jgi:hypothetical protein
VKLYQHPGEKDQYLLFYCPGCKEVHAFDKRWTFDGNMEAPTFSPSLRIGPYWREPPGWDRETAPKNPDGSLQLGPDGRTLGAVEWTCHSFVRAGRIEFLGDCTHELTGKTVDLPELPEWAL